MQLLQILDQVLDLGHIQKLSDDVGRLHMSNSIDILDDGVFVVSFLETVVSMVPGDFREKGVIVVVELCEAVGQIEVTLPKEFF